MEAILSSDEGSKRGRRGVERSKSQAEAVSDEDNEDKTRKPVSSQPQSVVVAGWAISNVALSVGLVTINKMLMQTCALLQNTRTPAFQNRPCLLKSPLF